MKEVFILIEKLENYISEHISLSKGMENEIKNLIADIQNGIGFYNGKLENMEVALNSAKSDLKEEKRKNEILSSMIKCVLAELGDIPY